MSVPEILALVAPIVVLIGGLLTAYRQGGLWFERTLKAHTDPLCAELKGINAKLQEQNGRLKEHDREIAEMTGYLKAINGRSREAS